ncbi:MAG: anaerobic sulfatase maturase [Desulfobacterales bacterium]|nr:anaerobic sulfatase maturase [Desulfobacterales bacterium]
MPKASREFQVFAKPTGAVCNLDCRYCYYLKKEHLYPKDQFFRMPDDILEAYIAQHIEAFPGPVINFSWHGGEPTLLGLDYFRKIVDLQRKYLPTNRRITNGMQTNGTLLNEDWCRFLATEDFSVGLSLDGPAELHDQFRITRGQKPTHHLALRGYERLQQHRISCDILCVVNAVNVQHPLRVYRFFKQIKATYIGFLPLVEPGSDDRAGVSTRTVPAEAWGNFLCTIFDEWKRLDIGRVKVQIFEETARTAFGREHALCIFRKTCGDIPVVEHNGDFFSCDHYVVLEHRLGNIMETPLAELLESSRQKAFGRAKLDLLPLYCRECTVREMCHGGCPKDRILGTPAGEAGLNYLCSGYKRFFNHCRPFIAELAAQWRRQNLSQPLPPGTIQPVPASPKTGRNDPCPCGSGRKYKKCCLPK